MASFRKKPIVIEAIRLAEAMDDELVFDTMGDGSGNWLDAALSKSIGEAGSLWATGGRLHIGTLEGTMRVDVGDYIVRGVHGEIYPVKPDIFAKTYEPFGAESAE